MKKLNDKISNGNKALVNGAIALFIVTLIALGCTCGKDFNLSNIGKEGDNRTVSNTDNKSNSAGNEEADAEALVKATVSDFASAVEGGDFTDFHAKTADAFQSSISIEEMNKKFSVFIDQKKATVPVLRKAAKTKMNFTDKSEKTEGGNRILTAAGTFQHSPEKVRFDNKYVLEDGKWKIINVGVFINK